MATGLMSPATINRMFRATPGAVAVSYGGVDGWGHYAQVPVQTGADPGLVVSVPSVTVADGYFPGIGDCESDGDLDGVGADIRVGDFVWTIRDIAHGEAPYEAPGEIVLLLSNRDT